MRDVPEHPHVKRFRTVRHNVYVGDNGSMEIVALSGRVELQRAGLDGRSVWELG